MNVDALRLDGLLGVALLPSAGLLRAVGVWANVQLVQYNLSEVETVISHLPICSCLTCSAPEFGNPVSLDLTETTRRHGLNRHVIFANRMRVQQISWQMAHTFPS